MNRDLEWLGCVGLHSAQPVDATLFKLLIEQRFPVEELLASRLHLVAGGFRSRDRLFRLHLTALCGESQRRAGADPVVKKRRWRH